MSYIMAFLSVVFFLATTSFAQSRIAVVREHRLAASLLTGLSFESPEYAVNRGTKLCPPFWKVSTVKADSLYNFRIEVTFCRETNMVIGNRLKELRESKNLSQGDIEKRTVPATRLTRS